LLGDENGSDLGAAIEQGAVVGAFGGAVGAKAALDGGEGRPVEGQFGFGRRFGSGC